jgi:hypothetical protein
MMQPAGGRGSFRGSAGLQLSVGVRVQLSRLAVTTAPSSCRAPASGMGKDRDGVDVTVRVDNWLAWLLDAYLDSKHNASALFEKLYCR